MKHLVSALRKTLFVAFLAAGLAVAVAVYAQQDTSDVTNPTTPGGGTSAKDILQRLQDSRSGKTSATKDEAPTARKPARTSRSEAKKGEEKPTAPEPAVTPPEQGKAGQESSAPTTIGGKSGSKGGAVRTVTPAGATGVTVQGGAGTFEPILSKAVEYGDVPDVGEAMTMTGPMPLTEFLETIAVATNWNILVTEAAQAVNLQFWITETKPKKALEILKFHDIYYKFDPETEYLYVMTKDEYLTKEFGQVKPETFLIEHVNIAYIETVVSTLLSANGRLITDPRTMHVYVWDTEDNLKEIGEKIKELDVPLQRAEFTVHYADLSDIEAVFSTLVSETGTIITDPRTGQIFVWDIPETIGQMELAFSELDVPLESRVFKLAHIDAAALTDTIEVLLSERGVVQVDPRINTLIVKDLPSRQDDIAKVIETLDLKLETRTWVIRYADPEEISENIETLVPEEMGIITVNEDTHQVTVTALPERLDEVDKLITTWDIKRRQVQIEAYLLTASADFTRQFGMNWTFFDSTGNTPISIKEGTGTPNWGATQTSTSTSTSSTATDTVASSGQTISAGQLPYSVPLRNWFTGDVINDIEGNPIIKELGGNRVSAVIDYLDSTGEVSVLSHPRVTVQDGEEAVFEKTSDVPYVTSSTYGRSSSYYNDNTTTNNNYNYNYASSYAPSNQIAFIPVGTTLAVVPRITEDDNIQLDIEAEDSTYVMIEVVGADEVSTVPQKTKNSTATMVLVHDGETLVIGGLRVGDVNDTVEKVPFLGDLPLIGRAFRNTKKAHKNQELLVFLTTTLVDEYTAPEAERLARAEEKMGEMRLHDVKGTFGRASEDVLGTGKNKIIVSIGQSGSMHSSGQPVTLEDLRKRFSEVKVSATAKVIIRKHPRAPERVATEVTELALEYGLKFEYDAAFMPFVPAYRYDTKEAAPEQAAVSESVSMLTPEAAPTATVPAPEGPAAVEPPPPSAVVAPEPPSDKGGVSEEEAGNAGTG